MILGIQTNVPGRLSVWLLDRRGQVLREKHLTIKPGGSDQLLSLIDRMLTQAKIRLSDVTRFVIVRGPGPFTPVRTGIVIGNTLAMVLRRPVTGIVSDQPLTPADLRRVVTRSTTKLFRPIKPWYGREPNISRPSPSRARMIRRHAGRGRARTAAK